MDEAGETFVSVPSLRTRMWERVVARSGSGWVPVGVGIAVVIFTLCLWRALDRHDRQRIESVPGRRYPRGVKRKMSNFPLRPRRARPLPPLNIQRAIKVLRKPCRRLK